MAKSGFRTEKDEVITLSLLDAAALVRRLEERLGVSGAGAAPADTSEIASDRVEQKLAAEQARVASVLNGVVEKLVLAIRKAGQTGKAEFVRFKVEEYMPLGGISDEDESVLLGVLPILRELTKSEKFDPFTGAPTETGTRLAAIAERARAALAKRDETSA